MKRRKFLISSSAVLIAGCTGANTPGTPENTRETPEDTPTSTHTPDETPTTTPTDTPEPAESDDFDPELIQITASWYDRSDELSYFNETTEKIEILSPDRGHWVLVPIDITNIGVDPITVEDGLRFDVHVESTDTMYGPVRHPPIDWSTIREDGVWEFANFRLAQGTLNGGESGSYIPIYDLPDDDALTLHWTAYDREYELNPIHP